MSARPEDGARAARPCAVCGAPPAERFRPFCSKRCADLDLSRWLKGVYAVAGDAETDEAGAEGGEDA